MIKFNTLLRVVYTLALSLILSGAAFAQAVSPQKPPTVLNFVKVSDPANAGFTVTNPTSSSADVTFTIYGNDGNPVASSLNPVRHRVAPKGQISMRAADLFAASNLDGWVQVTSATSGLAGFYLLGDFATRLSGAEPAAPLSAQVVPYIRDEQGSSTELVVVNPDSGNATVTITLHSANGDERAVFSRSISGHGAVRIPATELSAAGAGILSASISASVSVAATAIVTRGNSVLFIPGQAVDQNHAASVRIAPDFLATGGFDSSLILTNPTGSPVLVTVTLVSQPALRTPSSHTFPIPAYGSISARTTDITGQPITPPVDGWLRVDSATLALAGLVLMDEGGALTAVPLQTTPLNGMIFSQIAETPTLFTGLAMVNPSASPAAVDVILVRSDGTTFASASLTVPANSKYTKSLREVLPDAWDPITGMPSGYFFLGSKTPIYGVAILGDFASTFLTSMQPSAMPPSFRPDPINVLPRIVRVDPGTGIQPGLTPSLRVYVEDLSGSATFILGGQSQNSRLLAPGVSQYFVDVPLSLESGFVNLIVRSTDTGLESAPFVLNVLSPVNDLTQTISGQAFYQKIDVTSTGLDTAHPVMVPVRNARVEVFSRTTGSVLEVSQTDLRGQFSVPIPLDPNLSVRVVSQLRTVDLRVQDNTNLNAVYPIVADIDGRNPPANLLLAEKTRVSGAFNILEMVQRANDFVKLADPANFKPLPVAIYWSTRNTNRSGNPAQGLVGTSFFNIANNTAYILGDRAVDSDEFDDAVIVHEYGHMLAAKYSRDDSPGGESHIGEALDPRLAWSEGWANFFSSVVRNDSIWRDSSGPNGANVFQFDLADNLPAGDTLGDYGDEGAVGSLLWNLSDEHPFSQIWPAFTLLKNDRFVYLPYFLDHFLDSNPSAVIAVVTMAHNRNIDLQLSVPPSVSNPFPLLMNVGTAVLGSVDSLTRRRTNLGTSSHFYTFTTVGGAASIRMDITGSGPGNNPNLNDLDLFLMDGNGRLIARSDSGGNGDSERINISKLPAAAYVVEIRSFYTKAQTGEVVFNSGSYKLSVAVQ